MKFLIVVLSILTMGLFVNKLHAKEPNLENLIGKWSIYNGIDGDGVSYEITINSYSPYIGNLSLSGDSSNVYEIDFDAQSSTGIPATGLKGFVYDGVLYLGIIFKPPYVSDKTYYVFRLNEKYTKGAGILNYNGTINCTSENNSSYECAIQPSSASYEAYSNITIIKDGETNKINKSNLKNKDSKKVFRNRKSIWQLLCYDKDYVDYVATGFVSIYESSFKDVNIKSFKASYFSNRYNFTDINYKYVRVNQLNNFLFMHIPSFEGIRTYFFKLNEKTVRAGEFGDTLYPRHTYGIGFEVANSSLGNCTNDNNESINCSALPEIENSIRDCIAKKY